MMEKRLNLKLLSKLLLTTIFSSLAIGLLGQGNWELEKRVDFNYQLSTTSIDRYGNLYCSSTQGDIYQYDGEGTLLNSLSSRQLGKVYLLEASHGLRLFAFYQDLQEFLMTDRFLANQRSYSINRGNGLIRLANLSMDLNLWVLDDDNLGISKLDLNNQQVLLNHNWAQNILDRSVNFTYIKEYKNRIYLLDQAKEVFVFDNMINLLHTIEAQGVQKIAFFQNTLFLYDTSDFVSVDLNTLNRKKSPLPEKIIEMQVHKERFYLFGERSLSIYRYNPL